MDGNLQSIFEIVWGFSLLLLKIVIQVNLSLSDLRLIFHAFYVNIAKEILEIVVHTELSKVFVIWFWWDFGYQLLLW